MVTRSHKFVGATNLVVNVLLIAIAATLTVSGVIRWRVVSARSQQAGSPTASQPKPIYAIGEGVGTHFGVEAVRQRETLVIALKKGCAQCIASARALRALADSLAPNVDLVVVTPNSDNDARAFLEEHHIRADRIMSGVTVSTYKITQTPTLIHLDRQGNVVGIWSGIVDDERQKEVEKNFTGPIARR